MIRKKTGLVVDAYFSATKAEWILKNIRPKGDLCFGTIDTWLIWKPDRRKGARDRCHQRVADDALPHRSARLGSRSAEAVPRASRDAAGSPGLDRLVRHHGAVRPRDPALRKCGRPAGGALRPGLRRERLDEEHLRDRLFHDGQFGRASGRFEGRPPDDAGLRTPRGNGLCARGRRLHRGGDDPVSARQPEDHRAGGGDGGAGDVRGVNRGRFTSCPPSWGWGRPTGMPRRGGRSWG